MATAQVTRSREAVDHPARKMALFAHSGTYDHLYQTVALAASGAAMGFEVHIFLSFWALRRLAKEDADRVDVPAYAAARREELERGRKEARLPPLRKMLEDAKSIGPVTVYACSTSMKLFGVTEAEARKVADEVLGTAAFLDRAQGAEVFLFI